MTSALADAVRRALREYARPEDAPAMAAYMKHVQPFLGVKTPARVAAVKAVLAGEPDREARLTAARELWGGGVREERYAALDVLSRSGLTPADLPWLEGWLAGADHWDVLDSLVSILGRLLTGEERRARVRAWRVSPHLWTRRAAVLAQLHAKRGTDAALLRETVAALRHEREFFIQKAIGWALREHAKTDAAWVRETVADLALSGLARRVALKHVGEA